MADACSLNAEMLFTANAAAALLSRVLFSITYPKTAASHRRSSQHATCHLLLTCRSPASMPGVLTIAMQLLALSNAIWASAAHAQPCPSSVPWLTRCANPGKTPSIMPISCRLRVATTDA
eukprot:1262089-Rhodomonas_salina.1